MCVCVCVRVCACVCVCAWLGTHLRLGAERIHLGAQGVVWFFIIKLNLVSLACVHTTKFSFD